MFCKNCGKEISRGIHQCPFCNTEIDDFSQPQTYTNIEEHNKGLAIAGFTIGIITVFIMPILGILSIIFGAIAIGTNENTESWNKPIWQYKNKALGFGRCSLIFGIINLIYVIFRYFYFLDSLKNIF